jgi:Mn2+/Fe2+ NRAMP family transporter
LNKKFQSTETKAPFWKMLSAGLITGAADDDPSDIATYSQVGAAYGYNTCGASCWRFH